MAYMSQQKKKELTPGVRKVLKKFGMKGTIAVRNRSTLVVNITEGTLDLLGDEQERINRRALRTGDARDLYSVGGNFQVNTVHAERNAADPTVKEFYAELLEVMTGKGTGWYDRSDFRIDYHDVAYYTSINIGRYDRPYTVHAVA